MKNGVYLPDFSGIVSRLPRVQGMDRCACKDFKADTNYSCKAKTSPMLIHDLVAYPAFSMNM